MAGSTSFVCFSISLNTAKLNKYFSTYKRLFSTGALRYDEASHNASHESKTRLSYHHNPGKVPLKMITLGQLVDQIAEKEPHRDAIISHFENKKLTFQQIKDQAEQLGAGLLKLGFKPGDRIALLGVNTIHWYISLLAAAKAGLITVMLNPICTPYELQFALKHIKARGIITDHKLRTLDYATMLAKLMPGMSSAEHGQPLSCPELPDLSFALIASKDKLPGFYRLEDVASLAANKQEIQETESRIEPEDPLCIMFSSGTTGTPKGTVLSHFGVINNSHVAGIRVGLAAGGGEPYKICVKLPLFHIFGTTLGLINIFNDGNTAVLPAPLYSKELTIEALQTYMCDFMAGTPTMLIDIWNTIKTLPKTPQLQKACHNMRGIICGGAFIPPEVTKNMVETFPYAKIANGWGMTEISGSGTTCFQDDSLEDKSYTIGYPLDHVEVKIVNNDGKIVPLGMPGEGWFRSPYNLIEYWEDEKKTKEAKTVDGWLKTGDIMTLREDGYVSFVGRKKDMINRGGENIFSAEIENFLLDHPDIVNAEVYPVNDDRLGEEVAVSIKLKPNAVLTETSFKEYCQKKMAPFKIPKYIRFVDQFPMTAAGKVKKYLLREVHEKELKEANAK